MPRYPKPELPPKTLPPFNPLLRYPIDIAAAFLCQGKSKTYRDIKEGRLTPIREGKLLFIPGAEIARLCAPPVKPS